MISVVVVLSPGAPEGLTCSASGLKRLKVPPDRLVEPGIELGACRVTTRFEINYVIMIFLFHFALSMSMQNEIKM